MPRLAQKSSNRTTLDSNASRSTRKVQAPPMMAKARSTEQEPVGPLLVVFAGSLMKLLMELRTTVILPLLAIQDQYLLIGYSSICIGFQRGRRNGTVGR